MDTKRRFIHFRKRKCKVTEILLSDLKVIYKYFGKSSLLQNGRRRLETEVLSDNEMFPGEI